MPLDVPDKAILPQLCPRTAELVAEDVGAVLEVADAVDEPDAVLVDELVSVAVRDRVAVRLSTEGVDDKVAVDDKEPVADWVLDDDAELDAERVPDEVLEGVDVAEAEDDAAVYAGASKISS